MILRALHVTVIAGTLAIAAACSPSPGPSTDNPSVRLVNPQGGRSYVEIAGLTRDSLAAVRGATLQSDQWSALFRVAVADEGPAMLGQYAVTGDTLSFTPAFPFESGRTYKVRFDPSRIPGRGAASSPVVTADIGRPATATTPTTRVERVYPSAAEVPENLLRIYIEFSAPMTRRGVLEQLHLLDERGREVEGAFLPLDYELWSGDGRRLTVLFDPGRVKEGILPNQQMGRALAAGHTYTLLISQQFQDANGLPLASEYRHTLHVGRARTDALSPAAWHLTTPAAGGREPLTVTFPAPLDRGLMMRAIGVHSGGAAVPGEIRTERGETAWVFTPDAPWRAGGYDLLALSILEDPAGNRIGRAFEIENAESVDKGPDAQPAHIPFTVRDRGTN